jgi:serine/threonine protein kinase
MKGSAQPFEADDSASTAAQHKAGDEPIPGYKLIEPLGKGGFGEVWKCEAPGGFHKAIKFVHGSTGSTIEGNQGWLASQELQAIELIKNIRHPFILTVERVETSGGTLIIVMELADRNLADLLDEYKRRGQTGVSRPELLRYLAEAAEALDLMNFKHGLQHLDIKPQNLFLVGGHVKVADFGLVNRLPHKKPGDKSVTEHAPRGITPRYVAPEILQHHISRRSDQYSLAIVYQELLTGIPPFNGRNGRQLFMQHLQALPDLTPLPDPDRNIVGRGLAKDPADRFPSCRDLVHALELSASGGSAPAPEGPAAPATDIVAAPQAETAPSDTVPADEIGADKRTDLVRRPKLKPSVTNLNYQNLLSRTPLGEIWEVQAPTGETQLAYHLQGFHVEDPKNQEKALSYLQGLRHPAVFRFQIAETTPHRIVLLFDPWGPSLGERCRQGELDEAELLQNITEAAQAVDELTGMANLYHLGLNPESVIQGLDGVQLRDFGFIAQLWKSGDQPLDGLNPRYAAPELARGRPGPTSDQYGLAMIYADLRLAQVTGKDRTRSAATGKSRVLDLTSIPAPERRVLSKALQADPERRFATCAEFADALAECHGAPSSATANTAVVRSAMQATQESFLVTLEQWLTEQEGRAIAVTAQPASADSVRDSCVIDILPGTAKLRLDVFAQEWNAQRTSATANEFRFFLALTRGFWDKIVGRNVGVEIQVTIEPVAGAVGRSRATFMIRPVNCPDREAVVRSQLVPAMLQSLRTCLNAQSERRGADRLPFASKITVRHRASGASPAEQQCEVNNVSRNGIGFIAPGPIEQGEIRILLSLPQKDEQPLPVLVKAMVKRCRPLPSAGYEIGAEFLREPPKS